jgi:DNA repair protein RadC
MAGKGAGYRIKDLATKERPRERLARLGASALADAELIGILLRTGMKGRNAIELAQGMLRDLGGLSGLHTSTFAEIRACSGVGTAKAAQIKAAIELGRRLAVAEAGESPIVRSPQDAADLIQYEMGALEQEHFRVLLLDTRNHVIGQRDIYRGSLNASMIRIGEVFRDAVRANAAAIIVAHNHPSGDPNPSPEDVAVTRAIVQAGRLLDIEVLDHLVIGRNRFISLKAKGLGFERPES